jgi:hypothetical protein
MIENQAKSCAAMAAGSIYKFAGKRTILLKSWLKEQSKSC